MMTAMETVPDATQSATPKAARQADYDLLTFYRENYFITGFTEQTQVKFQFSAKYDLWPNEGQHAVYFAYTQLSLWNLYDLSSPFAETNYAPELFYIYFHHPGRYEPPPGCAFFHERGGYEHVSNGEAGARSRGWNLIYAESRFACYGAEHNFGLATLKAWFPFDKGDNPNIADYLGYGELQLAYGDEGGNRWYGDYGISAALRKGTVTFWSGSLEVDVKFRPQVFRYSRFTPWLYAQFFTGYGQTLLTYNVTTTSFRVGIAFSDRITREE